MKRKPLTPVDEDRLRRLLRAGRSLEVIAGALGRPKSEVRALIAKEQALVA